QAEEFAVTLAQRFAVGSRPPIVQRPIIARKPGSRSKEGSPGSATHSIQQFATAGEFGNVIAQKYSHNISKQPIQPALVSRTVTPVTLSVAQRVNDLSPSNINDADGSSVRHGEHDQLVADMSADVPAEASSFRTGDQQIDVGVGRVTPTHLAQSSPSIQRSAF